MSKQSTRRSAPKRRPQARKGRTVVAAHSAGRRSDRTSWIIAATPSISYFGNRRKIRALRCIGWTGKRIVLQTLTAASLHSCRITTTPWFLTESIEPRLPPILPLQATLRNLSQPKQEPGG